MVSFSPKIIERIDLALFNGGALYVVLPMDGKRLDVPKRTVGVHRAHEKPAVYTSKTDGAIESILHDMGYSLWRNVRLAPASPENHIYDTPCFPGTQDILVGGGPSRGHVFGEEIVLTDKGGELMQAIFYSPKLAIGPNEVYRDTIIYAGINSRPHGENTNKDWADAGFCPLEDLKKENTNLAPILRYLLDSGFVPGEAQPHTNPASIMHPPAKANIAVHS